MGKFRNCFPDPIVSQDIDKFLTRFGFEKGEPESINFKNCLGYRKTFITDEGNLAHIHVNDQFIRIYKETKEGKELACVKCDSKIKNVDTFENHLDILFEEHNIESPYYSSLF